MTRHRRYAALSGRYSLFVATGERRRAQGSVVSWWCVSLLPGGPRPNPFSIETCACSKGISTFGPPTKTHLPRKRTGVAPLLVGRM